MEFCCSVGPTCRCSSAFPSGACSAAHRDCCQALQLYARRNHAQERCAGGIGAYQPGCGAWAEVQGIECGGEREERTDQRGSVHARQDGNVHWPMLGVLWFGAWIDEVHAACDGVIMRGALHLALLGSLLMFCSCKVGDPNGLERRTVVGIKHHITVGGKSVKNPVSFTPEHLADGKEAFGHYCVVCHG